MTVILSTCKDKREIERKKDMYTVKAGDSFWSISRKFGLTLDELLGLNGLTADHIIHPGDQLIVSKNYNSNPPITPNPTGAKSLQKVVQWFRDRTGGSVRYSNDGRLRQGPNYYDCSSAVYAALIAGGFLPPNTVLGWTGSMFSDLVGNLLIPIDRSEARFGDVFISGNPPGSHTGVFVSNSHIVHMVDTTHHIKETPLQGWVGAGPIRCYRLKGADSNSQPEPQPKPKPQPQPQPQPQPNPGSGEERLVTSYPENGKFTANQTVHIHNQHNKNSPIAATLYSGESVFYDYVYITNKYVWISYISYSGVRRYVPIRTYNNGVKGPIFGTIV